MTNREDCPLCTMAEVKSGKDTLLHETHAYYIVDNGNTDLDGKTYARRISMTHKAHLVAPAAENAMTVIFRKFVKDLGYKEDEFFIHKTMNTYPDHWHIHAYILPILGMTVRSEIEKELLTKITDHIIEYIETHPVTEDLDTEEESYLIPKKEVEDLRKILQEFINK